MKVNRARQILHKLVDEIPDQQLGEVVDFIQFLKSKKEKVLMKELENASQSSTDFWDNEIDDEVWNNV